MRAETIGASTLSLADCREVLADLRSIDAVIADPPWDQANGIPGADNPRGLFADVAPFIARARRAVIQLGCYTSPAFLTPLMDRMPFVQALWLEYSCPSYRGRVLVNADLAYAFGTPIPSRRGARVIPSKTASHGRRPGELPARGYGRNRASKQAREFADKADHPMPRHLNHVRWLVHWWSDPDEAVLDPFMGSGTTGVACAGLGRRFIGVEIDAGYFDIACRRIEEAYRQPDLFWAAEGGGGVRETFWGQLGDSWP